MKTLSTKYSHFWLLVLRVAVAAFMISHGFPKLTKLIAGGEIKFPDPLGVSPTLSLILVVFSEFVCSIALALGIFARFAASMLAITMGVAAFVTHASDPFQNKEMALVYLLIYITIVVFGAGRYSLDFLRKK